MAGQQELQVQQKREVEKAQEATRPMRAFLPNTDIFETEGWRCRAWTGKISI